LKVLSSLGKYSHETYLSAFRDPQEADPRLSGSHAHARWSGSHSSAARERPGASGRLKERRRYRRTQRLATSDILALLSGGRIIGRSGVSVSSRANSRGIPRLGLIVPKRVFPRAVDRNRVKRVLREWFRNNQSRLGSRDILVRITRVVKKELVMAEVENCLAGSQ